MMFHARVWLYLEQMFLESKGRFSGYPWSLLNLLAYATDKLGEIQSSLLRQAESFPDRCIFLLEGKWARGPWSARYVYF